LGDIARGDYSSCNPHGYSCRSLLACAPHQRQVEKRYAEKVAEIERLREKQRALATPDPELNRQIEALDYDLGFEERPHSLGGDLNRQ
jgi:hypothetical protein